MDTAYVQLASLLVWLTLFAAAAWGLRLPAVWTGAWRRIKRSRRLAQVCLAWSLGMLVFWLQAGAPALAMIGWALHTIGSIMACVMAGNAGKIYEARSQEHARALLLRSRVLSE